MFLGNFVFRFSFLGIALVCLSVFSAPASAESRVTYLGASDSILGNPHDLMVGPEGKYLYIADVNFNRIAVLDPETLEWVGEFGQEDQAGTHDIDFDQNGNAYVADTHNNRVLIYTVRADRGRLTGELNKNIRGPEGVLVHPDGRIYVAGAWSNNLVVYKNKKVVNELNGLSSPHDLAFDNNGDIWLADAGNDRLLLLSPELDIKRELSGPPFNFNGVRYLDVMDDGTIIAADKNNHSVKIISASLDHVQVIGGEAGLGENVFRTPEGVEVQGSTVWISDSGNDRIVKYKIE